MCCHRNRGKGSRLTGKLVYFDRTKEPGHQFWNVDHPSRLITENLPKGVTPDILQRVVAGSTALLSGTVFVSNEETQIKGCWTKDWNVAVLSNETANVINYHAGDVSTFCAPATTQPPTPVDYPQSLFVVMPVHAVWVEITGFPGNLNDPARKASGDVPTATPLCYLNATTSGPQPDAGHLPSDIRPCDINQTLLRSVFYHSGWLYNRLTAPGVWAGSFSISPVVVKNGAQSITEDIRFASATKAGVGWLGLSVMLEKSPTVTTNLDSLTGAITYDFHLAKNKPWWVSPWRPKEPSHSVGPSLIQLNESDSGIGIRPGELLLSSGQEYTPTRIKGAMGVHEPKDLNVVEAISYRQPISITYFRYPSFITLFSMVGLEGGWHLIRSQENAPPSEGTEGAQFFRQVLGADASIRYPFQGAPNFTSTKAATIDFSVRERFLSGNEPYLDASPGGNPMLTLSRQRRAYYRASLNWPLSSYVAITSTVQRGSLPPVFASVSWTLTLGLAFGSTGIVEH